MKDQATNDQLLHYCTDAPENNLKIELIDTLSKLQGKKRFREFLYNLFGLNFSCKELMEYFITTIGDKSIIANSKNREQFLKDIYSPSTVNICICKLSQVGLLKRESRGVYRINEILLVDREHVCVEINFEESLVRLRIK